MFALFTKLAWMAAQPSSLILAALVVALWKWSRDHTVGGWWWLAGAIVALVLAGLSSLGDLLTLPLENRFPRPDLGGPPVTGLIVLGGGGNETVASTRNVIAISEAGGRYLDALALARRFPEARVVFSGGSDALSGALATEAETAARMFAQLGIDKSRLTLEDKSRTTWENALFTSRLLTIAPGERWLLVTSAWQMPRAIGAFRKVGLNVEAYPSDYRTTGRWLPLSTTGSISEGLRRFDGVLREYPGLLVYWLSGRSSALFPGPA